MKRNTIKDIAKMAGVNPSTVSRALNGKENISAKMQEKIREIAKLLHYRPNSTALNFKSKQSKTIGLILPKIAPYFIPQLIRGILNRANDLNYKLLILISEDSVEKESEHIATCIENDVDGILISLSSQSQNIEHLEIARQSHIPVLLLDKSISQTTYPELKFDNFETGKLCAEKLMQRNPQHILAIFGNESLEITQERKKGFDSVIGKTTCSYIYANSSQDAHIKCREIFNKYNSIDSIFCMSDEVMLGVKLAIRQLGLSQKFQYKMVGVSDGEFPQYINPTYSYLFHNGEEMGNKAFDILLDSIKTEKFSYQEYKITSPWVEGEREIL